jgi:hypothetical protein
MLAGTAARREPLDAPRPACDFCRAPLVRGDRRRLTWDSGGSGDLVLADLCSPCANKATQLLDSYGGHGRNAIRLTQAAAVSAAETTRLRRAGDILVRNLLYALIALVAFVLVTLLTSRG